MTGYTPATDLPTGQKMVLLMLRQSDLSRAILEHLREMSVPMPEKADWAALYNSRHIHRHIYFRGQEQHTRTALTPGGLHSVSDIMRDYARKFGIHSLHYTDANGNQGPSVRCIGCGWSTYAPRGRDTVLSRYAAQHLRQAEGGTLPEAYTLPKFQAMEAAE